MKSKKPTMKEVRNAINNMGQWVQGIEIGLNQLDVIVSLFIKYMDKDNKFDEFVKKESKKMQEQEALNEKKD